jgi:hypothetical protein
MMRVGNLNVALHIKEPKMQIGGKIEKWIAVWFVALCVCCFFVIAATTLFILHRDVILKDQPPVLQPLVPRLPQQTPWEIPVVDVGMRVNNILAANIARDEIVVNVSLAFQYDPEIVSANTIDKFSFEHGTIEEKELPRFSLSGKLITAQYRMRVRFARSFNFEQFPLDDHKIYLMLINNAVSSDQLLYRTTPKSMIIDPNIQVQGWSIRNTSTKVGVLQAGNIVYPAALFAIDFQKQAFGHLFTIIIPLIILFFITLTTLIPSKKDLFSLNFSAGNIAALLAYRFVIQNITPMIGYLTIADKLYGFVLIASILCLIFNLFGITGLTEKRMLFFRTFSITTTILLSFAFIVLFYKVLFGGF